MTPECSGREQVRQPFKASRQEQVSREHWRSHGTEGFSGAARLGVMRGGAQIRGAEAEAEETLFLLLATNEWEEGLSGSSGGQGIP